VQVGTKAQTGALITSTQPLRFGGDAVWPEWFDGRLDEIRIYDRALTAAQVQSDMAAPVTGATLMSAKALAVPVTAGAKRATRRRAGVIIRRFRGTHAHGAKPRWR
jgi:hypothetical protein